METKKFCGEVHRNLTLALLVKRIVIDETKRNLYHSKKKPWFTDELSELWKFRTAAEKRYCNSDNRNKKDGSNSTAAIPVSIPVPIPVHK